MFWEEFLEVLVVGNNLGRFVGWEFDEICESLYSIVVLVGFYFVKLKFFKAYGNIN